MYKHQNDCLVPRPDFGRRIDLSMYRDPDSLLQTPTDAPNSNAIPVPELLSSSNPVAAPEPLPSAPADSIGPNVSLTVPSENLLQAQVQISNSGQMEMDQTAMEVDVTVTAVIGPASSIASAPSGG